MVKGIIHIATKQKEKTKETVTFSQGTLYTKK